MEKTVHAYIGIGSNRGDKLLNICEGIKRIGMLPDTHIKKRSGIYITEPVGYKDQEWFINCVVEIETKLNPWQLLYSLKSIEGDFFREKGIRFGPRELDLDIILYGDMVIRSDDLEVPHPRYRERGFVLIPLCEIAADMRDPEAGITIRQLRKNLVSHEIVVKLDEKV